MELRAPPGVLKLFMHIDNTIIGQWIITPAVKQAKAILTILLRKLPRKGIFCHTPGVRQ